MVAAAAASATLRDHAGRWAEREVFIDRILVVGSGRIGGHRVRCGALAASMTFDRIMVARSGVAQRDCNRPLP
jgi:hypothetical protein